MRFIKCHSHAASFLPTLRISDDGERCSSSAHQLRTRSDLYPFRCLLNDHPLHRHWKPRPNNRVRLLRDASAFIDKLQRPHFPAWSFLAFSQGVLIWFIPIHFWFQSPTHLQ